MTMSTFDTNTQIIQEEAIDIDKDILFHGGIFDGVYSFDPGTLTIHMRSSFVQMTGISTFILSSKLSCIKEAIRAIEHFRASCRSYIAKSNNPKLERQEFINRFFTDVKNRYISYNQ